MTREEEESRRRRERADQDRDLERAKLYEHIHEVERQRLIDEALQKAQEAVAKKENPS